MKKKATLFYTLFAIVLILVTAAYIVNKNSQEYWNENYPNCKRAISKFYRTGGPNGAYFYKYYRDSN